MKELKFRVWSEDQKTYDYKFPYNSIGDFYVSSRGKVFSDFGNVIAPEVRQEAFIVEQYTGLEDRGVEIYEGDIIRWMNSTGREITAPVVWNTRAWCWTAGDYMLGGLLEFDLEVVGNIHEDLKLLEAA